MHCHSSIVSKYIINSEKCYSSLMSLVEMSLQSNLPLHTSVPQLQCMTLSWTEPTT